MALLGNLRFYQVHSAWPISPDDLSRALQSQPFKPCGSLSERSLGFEAPGPDVNGSLCRQVSGADLIRLRSQSRVLPAAAVKEALDERVQQFTTRTTRPPSRKEKRELKEDVYHELLAQALLKSDRTYAFYLHTEELLAIDTASEKDAEAFIDKLRDAFGSLLVTPLSFGRPIGEFLTRLYLGSGPTNLIVGRECRMQDPVNTRTAVQWTDLDIADSDVRKHIHNGLQLDRLGVEFDEVMSCVIDREGVFRKLKLLGVEKLDEALEEDILLNPTNDGERRSESDHQVMSNETELMRLDTEFVLYTGTISRLLNLLKKNLDGYAKADEAAA